MSNVFRLIPAFRQGSIRFPGNFRPAPAFPQAAIRGRLFSSASCFFLTENIAADRMTAQ